VKKAMLKVCVYSVSQTAVYWMVILHDYAGFDIYMQFTEMDQLCKDCTWNYEISEKIGSGTVLRC